MLNSHVSIANITLCKIARRGSRPWPNMLITHVPSRKHRGEPVRAAPIRGAWAEHAKHCAVYHRRSCWSCVRCGGESHVDHVPVVSNHWKLVTSSCSSLKASLQPSELSEVCFRIPVRLRPATLELLKLVLIFRN